MRRIYKSMIWVSVLALSAGAVSAQKAERKNVREGNKLYESEKYTESEIAYRKSLEVNPRSTEGTYNLGNSLYKQGKFPEAAEQYQLIAGQGEKMVLRRKGRHACRRCIIIWEISSCRTRITVRPWRCISNRFA